MWGWFQGATKGTHKMGGCPLAAPVHQQPHIETPVGLRKPLLHVEPPREIGS